ncbi:MAG: ATP-binding protein [Candidatus Hodarchaeota archaeon]
MCKMCLKHGVAGKWYFNAKNYLKKTAEEANAYEYLEETWGTWERAYVRKVFGILNMRGASRHANTPILGRIIKWYANRGFLKDGRKKHLNLNATQGHFGQVIPLEEAKIIVREKADVVARAYCPCKYFNRGMKSASCLAFSPLLEVLPKLPRYIPENGLKLLDRDQAAAFLDDMSKKGYIHTIWTGPVPAIIALCACDITSCGALRLSRFGVKPCWKGEYVAVVEPNNCIGCKKCASFCQFGALSFSPLINMPIIKPELCYGCGICMDQCENKGIKLIDRNEIPITRGDY